MRAAGRGDGAAADAVAVSLERILELQVTRREARVAQRVLNRALSRLDLGVRSVDELGALDEALRFHGLDGEDSCTMELPSDGKFFVNVGSVGQPRDDDPETGYVLYDSETQVVTFRRLSYDIEREVHRIRSAGLPTVLAERLYLGV